MPPAPLPSGEGRPGRPLVMGILNVTPDSFSDGGRFITQEAALAQAQRLATAGADMIDIGGESTRPGAAAVSETEEMSRVLPLIEAIASRLDVPLSVDTRKPAVARAAIAAGAAMWNDVTALRYDPESLATAAELGCPVVLMHMRGEPATMQLSPNYDDVVGEVAAWLAERAEAAIAAGVAPARIWLDPGIGFGKTLTHNLALIGALDQLVSSGFPVLLGASRKGMIRTIDASALDPGDRLGGSLALALAGAAAGVAMIRVHDVRETVQALQVSARIAAAKGRHG